MATRTRRPQSLLNQTQGDVQIRPCTLPKEAKPFDAKSTLAYGEVTGHAHRVKSGTVEFLKWQERTFLRVTEESTIAHEEHKPVVLPPGDYEYGITREYDYDLEESRRVAD